ncbi:MAG: RsmE family RNA methyltransferase [Trueperaceae bacterium]
MRRHRIHIPRLAPGAVYVIGPDALHLTQVLRVTPGSTVRAFDGNGNEADGIVVAVESGRVLVELDKVREGGLEATIAVTIAVALLKGDKLSDVVRHCTELGAKEFAPILAKRRDVPGLSGNKLDRLRRVAREAAKQCGRAVVPEVFEPVDLAALQWSGIALVAHPHAQGSLADTQREAASKAHEAITIITGPEGGFTQEEVGELESRGALGVRLGARVLRAETAPVALLAALLVPEAL